jgi:hypothetical protein
MDYFEARKESKKGFESPHHIQSLSPDHQIPYTNTDLPQMPKTHVIKGKNT